MKKDRAHVVAFFGVMTALIFVAFLIEGTLLSGLSITACVLSLPLAIAVSICDDYKSSFVGGTILGCCSMVFCLIFSGFIFYANPFIAILPRTCVGIVAFWVYRGFLKLFNKAESAILKETVPASLAGVVGSVTNTVLYLISLQLWKGDVFGAFNAIVSVAVTIYFPIELAACCILVPTYTATMRRITRKCHGGGGNDNLS